jgi:CHRD domain
MRKILFQQGAMIAVAVLSVPIAWLGIAHGAPVSFKVPLSGGQEVPPVFPAGAAMAELTYDSVTRVVTWTLTYTALSGPITVVQFHGPAQPSKNAPPAVAMVKQGSPAENPITGQATLTPDQAQQFADGEWYINIETQNHPEGEIRGQIITPLASHAEEAHPSHRLRRGKH